MSSLNTFIKNICTNCYKHPFICILIPCFPYVFYQNCITKYRFKVDDEDDNDNEWTKLENGTNTH